MVFSQITTEIGEVNSISIKAEYLTAPLALFSDFLATHNNALLLESAEIDSKDNLKSLMLLDTAVKFECHGARVYVEALVENGKPVLTFLHECFIDNPEHAKVITFEPNELVIEFNAIEQNISEETRLKQSNAFEVLRSTVDKIKSPEDSPFSLFLGGAFSYDMLANFEQLPDVPLGQNSCPDYIFYLAETMVIIDHQNKTTELLGNVFGGENAYSNCFSVGKKLESIKKHIEKTNAENRNLLTDESQFGFNLISKNLRKDVTVNVSDEQFKQQVIKLKNNIIQGDVFQVVPSRCFSLECQSPLDAYRHLKKDNPSPYMFYLKSEDFVLFGASPESALKYCSESRQVEIYPIAGTRVRGFNSDGSINNDLDSRIELDLRNDKKEVAEHMMLVDLARNDVARISETGSRHTKELLKVDRYSYVMHLISRVVGSLRSDLDALHAYQACMNMGTLVGAPKISAATLIRETEQQGRGSYGGAVGYLNGAGDMDTCIVIRSAFVKDGIAHVQAGAGVVYDSDPDSEVQETFNKAQAVIRSIKASEAYQTSNVSNAASTQNSKG
ncbi:MAG: anthranilate synthase component 1 [Gammaproteobacteria bacterium]|nr:anthranilate synthase component 1 [Gammaproteobacteria bacterium]